LRKAGANIDLVAVSEVYKDQEDKVCDYIKRETGTEPKRYVDYNDMLADDKVDAVCIGTPDHWHARQTIDAMKAGKHVYCEKPMTHTVEEAMNVVDAWRSTGKVMQVGVQSTSLPIWDHARQLIDEGKLGKVLQFQTEYYRNSKVGQWRYYQLTPDMSPKTIDWQRWLGVKEGLAPDMPFDRAVYKQWRCYWPFGSGMYTDLFVHRTTSMLKATGLRYPARVVGAGGIALEWRRIKRGALRARSRRWQLWLPAIVYCIALAPVLALGEVSFSAYNVLTDSAFHMVGADYLIRHGQDYAHLDLHNSYGRYLTAYYGSGYPSGADTFFGGSASILGVPLIWAFQPFNAFVLALAAGPAWLLARRAGLAGPWAALAGLIATIPALVFAYALIGSIKEVTGLALVLTLGALVVMHERWLRGPPPRVVPVTLVAAAGISVLGAGFGAWVLACAVPLAAVTAYRIAKHRDRVRDVFALVLAAAGVAAVAAWPTWSHLSKSVGLTQSIVTTSKPGNLGSPLQIVQVFGTWLSGLYTSSPHGIGALLSYGAIAVTALLAVVGTVHLLRNREGALGGWIAALIVLLAVGLSYATTWVDAKALMLSSPLVLLLAWSGVAAILEAGAKPVAAAFALVLSAGVIASDVMQYRATDLAPPARYAELASLDSRFAGRGPALFTDWDEYALYELLGQLQFLMIEVLAGELPDEGRPEGAL